jgi:hypothetical protein
MARYDVLPSEDKRRLSGWSAFDHIELAALAVMKMAVDGQLPLGVARTLGEMAGPHVAFFMSIWVGDELGDFMRARLNLGSGHRFLIFELDGRQVVIVAKDIEATDRAIDLSDVARHLVERAAEAGISIVQREAQA